MSTFTSSPFAGGTGAVRYAQTRSLLLSFPILTILFLSILVAFILSPTVALKRAQATQQAWSVGGSKAQQALAQCLSDRGKQRGAQKSQGDRFAYLHLLEDVEFCEESVITASARGPIVMDHYTGPAASDVEKAKQARQKIFSSTFRLNKADIGASR